jgi:hypothetical protein
VSQVVDPFHKVKVFSQRRGRGGKKLSHDEISVSFLSSFIPNRIV